MNNWQVIKLFNFVCVKLFWPDKQYIFQSTLQNPINTPYLKKACKPIALKKLSKVK